MTPDLTLVRAFPTLLALGLAPCCAPAAEIYPPTDPPLPTLIEPGQTEEPSVYRARRDALMKEIGEGVAVIFAKGHEDGDGFRQSSDFFFLTGVRSEEHTSELQSLTNLVCR